MKTRLRICSVALLAAVVAASISHTAWAQRSGRSIVAGRQQVRAALAVAMADGKLTNMEQYSILQKGKKLLSPVELQDLKQSLIQLTDQEGVLRPAAPAKTPDKQQADDHATEGITQTTLIAPDETKRAKTASFEELADPEDADLARPTDQDNPFQEEALPEVLQPMDDASLAFPEGLEGCEDCEGGERFGGGGLFPCGPAVSVCDLPDIRLSTSVEAFKGPLDLDNRNGNFGLQFAVNGGFPLAKRLGIGVQAGTSGVLSDFQGTQFTGSTIRSQNFTTVGLFQRVPLGARRLKWGFAFDWLYDDYYSSLQMSQWRVKLGYELNCSNEIGISARIPNDGDLAKLGDGIEQPYFERFKPVAQGLFYYNHSWATGPSTTAWLGIVDEPGEMIFGADARLPLTCSWALVGNFNYVLPSASGAAGQDEEMWNLSVGIEFTPGWIGNHSLVKKYSPMFPLANNGTFAIRRY